MENTSPKFFCFVLMPFNTSFDDIYTLGIKESCHKVNAYCERVDEQIYHGTIPDRIYNQISKADLIIADMSGKNPNVFYEVGYAHALNKPTILLTQTTTDIPFDLRHYPHIIYDGKISVILEQLPKRIEFFRANSKDSIISFKTAIDLFVDGKNLELENVDHEYYLNQQPNFTLAIHNASGLTYKSGSFQIGIICEDFTKSTDNVVTTPLPDGTFLHMLPTPDSLLPEAFTSIRVVLDKSKNKIKDNFRITIRLFTESGTKDFNLNLKRLNVRDDGLTPDMMQVSFH